MAKSKIPVSSNFLKPPTINIKDRKKSRSFNYSIIISIVLVLIVIGVSAAIYFTGFLNIKNISITGNVLLSKKEIEDVVKKEASAKLILSVNPVSIESKLQEQFSLLSYVRVTKQLPSTLVVEVRERKQAVVFKTLENIVVVSQDGVVTKEVDISEITNNTYNNLNIITLIDEPKRSVGYKFDSGTVSVDFINSLTSLMKSWQTNNSPAFTDVFVDNSKNIKFALSDGANILMSLNDPTLDVNGLVADITAAYKKFSQGKKVKTLDARLDNKIAVTYF